MPESTVLQNDPNYLDAIAELNIRLLAYYHNPQPLCEVICGHPQTPQITHKSPQFVESTNLWSTNILTS